MADLSACASRQFRLSMPPAMAKIYFNEREFASFTLKAKSSGSPTYDLTALQL
jgi:hypothetical protein